MRGMATIPQGNQELLVVRDKVWRPPGELGVSKSMECDIFPSVLWHCWLGDRKGIRTVKQEAQLMLINLRNAIIGQSRSPNIAPFHMLGIVSYCAIVTLSLRHAVFTIFNFKKCCDLKIGSEVTQGHWKWYHSIDCVWFPISVFSNFVLKCTIFWDIHLQKCCDLENRVRGPWRSFEMSPCDRAHTTSYWRSIVTMALSHVVSEIFNVEKCRDLEIGVRGHSRSMKVVPFRRTCIVSY